MTSAGGRADTRRWLKLCAALMLIAVLPAAADSPRMAGPPRGLEIVARPIDSFDVRDASRRRFGQLEYIGGIELTSPDKDFGELSALRLNEAGTHFMSVNDKGRWFRGRIVYRDGKPAGIADAETAPILGADGAPLADRGWFDTESLADDGEGTLYVGVERVNQIVRFDYGRDGLLARGSPIDVPPAVKTLPFNQGLETLVFIPRKHKPLGGTLVAISERGLDRDGNILGFLIGGAHPGAFTIKRSNDYDVTDAAVLPDGNVLILERFFAPTRGIAMRIRRLNADEIRPGAVVDGPVLMEADMGYQIDNMEGLAVHRNAAGELVLTLISDDNFNVIQRTLLLQFKLVEP